MKMHFAKVTERSNGAIRTSTLCERMSSQSVDGMNSTDNASDVTCALCLRKLRERNTIPDYRTAACASYDRTD